MITTCMLCHGWFVQSLLVNTSSQRQSGTVYVTVTPSSREHAQQLRSQWTLATLVLHRANDLEPKNIDKDHVLLHLSCQNRDYPAKGSHQHIHDGMGGVIYPPTDHGDLCRPSIQWISA
jgi:hypothetical protein